VAALSLGNGRLKQASAARSATQAEISAVELRIASYRVYISLLVHAIQSILLPQVFKLKAFQVQGRLTQGHR
jgi:hypothetical protein